MHAVQCSRTRGWKKNARRAINSFAARFLWLNPPACRGHTPATDSAPSPLSAPSVHTPRACCRAASPALPAVPGYCRTRPRWRCSQWQGWYILEPGFHPVGVHVVAAGKQFRHSRILQDLIYGVRSREPMTSSRCRMKWFLVCAGVSARFLHGFKTCKGCKSLQKRTKGAETRSSKPAMYRKEMTLKRNFQKLRESPGVRYESVGRGFESLPSHQVKSHD